MKKFTALFMLLFVSIFMASCKIEESHDPLETFYNYIDAYENLDFERMYSLLDEGSKERISQADYLVIYNMIYKGIPITEAKMEPRMENIDIQQKVQGKDEVKIPTNMRQLKAGEEITYSTDVTLKREVDQDDQVNFKVSFAKELVYDKYAMGDTIETKEVAPIRGEIFDRNHKPLAVNGEILWIGMISGKSGAKEGEAIQALSQAFSIKEEFIKKKLNQKWVKDNMFVDMIKAPIERKGEMENLISLYPGITYRVITGRVYPYGEAAAHLTGYLGLINKEEFVELEPLGFPIDTMVGRAGLELILEAELRGQLGTETFLMGKDGVLKERLITFQNNKGRDVTLTIDMDRQEKLYLSMEGEPGTASDVDYKTGEIYALVSSPAYDPNKFVFGHTKESYNALLNDENNPLLNRFTKLYSPGSTIKPLMAAMALEKINYDENKTLDISGKKWQKDPSWGNYNVTRVTDPGIPINLEDALVYSDNIYFAQMALEMGGDNLIAGMKDFGIGEPLNLGFKFDKDQLMSEGSVMGDILLADSGYGQGQVLFHSLSLPEALTAMANGGNKITLSLFKGDESKSINILSQENADQVFSFMKSVVERSEGTGHTAYMEGRNLGGKTGTAEIGTGKDKKEIGWFTVIEKNETNPFITTMMLENTKDRGGSLLSVQKVKQYLTP